MQYTILYIEDDKDDIDRMKRKVDQAKFQIFGVNHGDEAVSIIKGDRDKKIKAVLLDVRLTDPDTGFLQRKQGNTILSEIKEIRPEMPVFAISWKSGISGLVNGYYPKTTLFGDKVLFKDFQKALEESINEVEGERYYPKDGGGKEWQEKWGPQYLRLRNDPSFQSEEQKIGDEARKDYDLLNGEEIKTKYSGFRNTGTLRDVLIIRRVIAAAAFSCMKKNKEIAWQEVSQFLRLSGEDLETLKDLMYICGIKWGNIITQSTLLEEEKRWLLENGFLRS